MFRRQYARFVLGVLLPLVTTLITGCSGGLGSGGNDVCANAEYWVSTSGNDASETGSYGAPFQTIDRARLAAQSNPLKGQCTINVNIESGTYPLQHPVIFGALDSGSAQHNVVYRAASDNAAPVVISGGMQVANFSCSGARLCTADVTGLPNGILPRQFYVGGQRAIRARSNYGASVNLDYVREPAGYAQILPQTLTHPELVEAVTVTQWKMMRCPVASQSGTHLAMQNPCWNNANTYPSPWNFQLLSWLENAPEFLTQPNMWYLDPYAKQLTYFNGSSGEPTNAVLPVLENLMVLEGEPGNAVSNITFQGLVFSYATWLEPNSNNGYVSDQSGNILLGYNYQSNVVGHQQHVYRTPGNIELKYANNISFLGNTFTHLGGVALDLDIGSQNNKIINNTFNDISSAAIQVGGVGQVDMRPNAEQEVSNNVIQNNVISYTGQDYYDSAAIFVGFTTGTTIAHNTISHTPWSSVAIGWGWGLFDKGGFPGLPGATPGMWGEYTTPTIASNNRIVSNNFSYFLEQLWDGGAIYTNGAQGQNFGNGLLIELNVAQNKTPSAGSNIYYTDGGSQYITLSQNVAVNNPVGTVNFGPCLTGSSISPLCLSTGVLPYGADMGGCLPVGDLSYTGNYFQDTIDFFGPAICHNSYIPAYPVDLSFVGNVPITSTQQVPSWILEQAGVQ